MIVLLMKRFFLSRKLDRILVGLGSPHLAAAGFQGQQKSVLSNCVQVQGRMWRPRETLGNRIAGETTTSRGDFPMTGYLVLNSPKV